MNFAFQGQPRVTVDSREDIGFACAFLVFDSARGMAGLWLLFADHVMARDSPFSDSCDPMFSDLSPMWLSSRAMVNQNIQG